MTAEDREAIQRSEQRAKRYADWFASQELANDGERKRRAMYRRKMRAYLGAPHAEDVRQERERRRHYRALASCLRMPMFF